MMHIPSLKSKTKSKTIKTLATPKYLYMPLQAYRGSLKPLVGIGDNILKHQKIASSEGIFASSIHAPVSGTVIDIISNDGSSYIKIENNFREEKVSKKPINIEALTKEQILTFIKEYGIEGSGGARFPSATKYQTNTQSISYFLINGAECEPYLSADYAVMQQDAEALIKAIKVVQKVIKAKHIIFGIEKQHKELKSHLQNVASRLGITIQVKLLPNTYPQGGELQLIKSLTKKEIPKGSIPANHGIMVNNVGTLWALYQAFYKQQPYTERIVTISGEKAVNHGNYRVAIGTPLNHILETLGQPWDNDMQTVILGGPMMGKAVHHPETPINKGSGGLLTMPNPKNKRYNCIQCGYCTDVCPQRLMPMEFARHAANKDTQKLNDFNLMDCIECGACAYICPSDVPLMQSIFSGKTLIQQA
ncbi:MULTISPECIES: electron transport complex subunit RsxC [Tenacibaculum]|uniref:Ion-translocating oxidoreductase complex subunit C n=1 Tax=Tenacibaculum sp. Pbs-1 TaxID=3238748 RepID=A0AB33L4C7_9FLAO|nr:electron transport complex subunit RsxC [Tenacibaculum mesophilum]KAF9660214.1 electron transport complex subunit RsxC [Tenacibaculum mesophilum]BFF37091.1 electron transport complex subunit RsxC [Tenacibaculum mesophilum]BFF40468.1 electron transport complex subunit RsxC [Tenacibaculum mesophilum]